MPEKINTTDEGNGKRSNAVENNIKKVTVSKKFSPIISKKNWKIFFNKSSISKVVFLNIYWNNDR